MHAIVNHLPIKPDTDWATLAAKVETFNSSISHKDFRGFSLIRAGTDEAILLALFFLRAWRSMRCLATSQHHDLANTSNPILPDRSVGRS